MILAAIRNLTFVTFLGFSSLSSAAPAGLPDFASLVEQASPAVVNISTRQAPQAAARSSGIPALPELEGLPPIFREFFERNIPGFPGAPGGPGAPGQRPEAQSLGSGFIISADGYVLTNNHVVAGADEIIVRMADRSELVAELVGADPRTDVALLKIQGEGLPSVRLGQSRSLRAGEWVLAIGSPFGFDHTVTAGIVSATGRSLPNESYVPFIQTDVAINPGNSGGPLFNLEGEVVGINSQIFTRSGGFMGLSFAIPIDVAMDVADQLRAEGRVTRGWLGVVIQEVNRDLAESFGLDRPAGALVAQVIAETPAAHGGLQVGDVILSVNDAPVIMSGDLPHLIGVLKPGSEARLEVVRGGERQRLSVEVGALPEQEPGQAVAPGRPAGEQTSRRLGLRVIELGAEQQAELGIQGGVSITQITGGPAAGIGLRQGDVITHLNNEPISTARDFTQKAEQLPTNQSISMRVLRQGQASFITFRLAE
ncbi:DegQ family serine endoprotease [Stutzerimonas tarimensis]|uniref:Probable periplasmic serine endoprotease DegP-like n=1 Tax=Stutzerimonas tarimensis TaxID=1507735 RepID=A0ABV7T8E9_9GAMM